jgi:hypothetical protein
MGGERGLEDPGEDPTTPKMLVENTIASIRTDGGGRGLPILAFVREHKSDTMYHQRIEKGTAIWRWMAIEAQTVEGPVVTNLEGGESRGLARANNQSEHLQLTRTDFLNIPEPADLM